MFLLSLVLWLGTAAPGVAVEYIDDQGLAASLASSVRALKEAGRLRTSRVLLRTIRSGKPIIPLGVPATGPRSAPTLYQNVQETVLVHCRLCHCSSPGAGQVCFSTAFAIAPDVVVVNHHAVDEDKEQFHAIADHTGAAFPVREILAVDRDNDIAIVHVEGANFRPLALVPDEPVGSQILVLSHPDEHFYVLTQGVIARYCRCRCPKQGGREWVGMSITADFARGSSGAPILNLDGKVVGMVASTLSLYYEEEDGHQKNLQMVLKNCVPARAILDLIRASHGGVRKRLEPAFDRVPRGAPTPPHP
ncbi:MAG: trypsin-like peptidase domain-containing protein [Candidatus Riflebacteria bacterium]|nr:trypsin-like peptidase domain-containing protein [Candidatus Riflebacteria bacterium]